MIPSNYKATIATIAAYLILNIAHSMETKEESESTLFQPSENIKKCLDGIAIVFEYTFQNENEKNYHELTSKLCLDIAIKKFKSNDMYAKYKRGLNDFNELTKFGIDYYTDISKLLDDSDVKSPVDFCEKKESCLDELKQIFGEKTIKSSYTCVMKLFKEKINLQTTYINLYTQHVIDTIKLFNLDDKPDTTEPIGYCKYVSPYYSSAD